MTSRFPPYEASAPPDLAPPPPARPSVARRVLAGLGGLLLLVPATVSTLGAVLLGPLGMLIAWGLARWRRRPLTRGASWLGAVLTVAVGFAIVVGVAVARLPPGTFSQVQRRADSTSAARRAAPRPPWLERMSRGSSTPLSDTLATRMASSRAFMIWTGVLGAMLACTLFGVVLGTLGWGAGMLLAYALRGTWLPTATPPPPPA